MAFAWFVPRLETIGLIVILGFPFEPHMLRAAPEFSGYLEKVLKNHTANACDGEQLGVMCPHKTSISVLSAFYGRRVPSQHLCPSPSASISEDTYCSSPVAIQKVLDECQDQRVCQFSVNSRLFGIDPCPGTFKYLIVSYKCKPDNHRVRTACEDEKLRLHCKNTSVLAIYSASYGRPLYGNEECISGPDIECLASAALRKVSRKCHGKQSCTIVADSAIFGDPCFPGVRKQLSVSYTCVPKQLLEEVGRDSPDPFSLSDYTHGLPEKVGLYFLCGVSVGLVFLLCIVTPKMAFLQEMKQVFLDPEVRSSVELNGLMPRHGGDDDDINHYDSSSDSSFRQLTRSFYTSNNIFSPELTATLEETTNPVGLTKDDIWIPKESSPYSISRIKAATK